MQIMPSPARMLVRFTCILILIMYMSAASAFYTTYKASHCIYCNRLGNPLHAKIEPSSAKDAHASKLHEVHHQINVPEIMALLQQTYPTDNTQLWAKTKNYLYQYRARSKSSQVTNTTNETLSKTKRARTKNLSLKNVQKMIDFLQSTFPNHPELQAHILQTSPRILNQYHSIESRLIPTIDFLWGLYGGLPDSKGVEGGMIYEAIYRNANLLLVRGVGYSGGGWEDKDADTAVEEYLLELGVSASGIAKLKKSQPTLFQVSLKQKVKPVVQYLSNLLGYMSTTSSKNRIVRLITNHPMLLHLDVESNLEPKARFVQTFCGMTDKELAVVMSSTPGILGLSLESNIKPTLQFLLDALTPTTKGDVSESLANKIDNKETRAMLRRSILKHPQILGLSLDNLRAKMSYFDQIDCCGTKSTTTKQKKKDGTLASKILLSAPSAYSLSLSNIAEKIDYLAAVWSCDAPNSSANKDHLYEELKPQNETVYLSDSLRIYPQVLTLSMEGNIKVR